MGAPTDLASLVKGGHLKGDLFAVHGGDHGASAQTFMPMGVAEVWATSRWVPTVPSSAAR